MAREQIRKDEGLSMVLPLVSGGRRLCASVYLELKSTPFLLPPPFELSCTT